MNERILWMGAHPDDMEHFVGGTLAKYVKKGDKVFTLDIAIGDKGSDTIPPDELAKMRKEESKKGAQIIGAEYIENLGVPDCEVYFERNLVLKIIDVIRKVKPTIILTHSHNDYMTDHINASRIVVKAFFEASLIPIKTKYPAHKTSRIYLVDTIYGIDFEPDFWIDITDTIDIKLEALKAHKSQIGDFLAKHFREDPTEACRSWSRFRGLQVGVKYAEAFKLVRKNLQLKPQDLLP